MASDAAGPTEYRVVYDRGDGVERAVREGDEIRLKSAAPDGQKRLWIKADGEKVFEVAVGPDATLSWEEVEE